MCCPTPSLHHDLLWGINETEVTGYQLRVSASRSLVCLCWLSFGTRLLLCEQAQASRLEDETHLEHSPVIPTKAMLDRPVPSQATPKHVRQPSSGQPSPAKASRGIQLSCRLVSNTSA